LQAPRQAAALAAAALAGVVLAACAPKPLPAPPPSPPVLEPPPAPEEPPPDPRTLPCERVVALAVRKRERTLTARCAEGGVRELPIALSREPYGAKRARGDRRSPEGDYHIAGKPRPSRFHLFIPIDYPSRDDADAGLAEGRISPQEHGAILRAHAAGRLPPQDTALGGWVGLHGEGPRWRGDAHLDWTDGCFAIEDDAIDWIAAHASIGTPIRIDP
jgi:hypothetical protein